jgi:subfamily B ATP-binding cassette protein MsbA
LKPERNSLHQQRLEAILARYRDTAPRRGAEKRDLLRLWHEYVSPLKGRLLLAILLMLALSLQPYTWIFLTRLVADYILQVGQPVATVELATRYYWLIGIFLLGCGIQLGGIICAWQYNYQITYTAQRIVFALRRTLHEKLTSLPLSFYDRTQTGRLLTVVLDDVATVQASITGTAVNFVTQVVMVLVGAVIICSLNWKLGLIILISLPFYVANFRFFRPRIREANIAARRATTTLYNQVEERVTAIRTVKVFGRERAEVRHFLEASNNLARLTMHIVRLGNWQNFLATFVSTGAIGTVLYLGVRELQTGSMSVGAVLQLYASAGYLFAPAVILSDLAMEVQRISVVMRRVFDLLEADPEPDDRDDAVALADAQGDIIFNQVTFTYPGDEHPTLCEVSVQIPAGKQVAVMGPSGAGKSTLLYLLMRFWDIDNGEITLDGKPLREITLRSLRDRITLVMQEPIIFSGTVAENIRYGRLQAADEEVRRAAADADLHEFILSLPDGYETVVGERGMSLSGGQRQRLALAASLLSRPSVLLLDDTTSALDAATEARVRRTLNRIMRGRTCFVVTHRISTALASDLVMVLEDGRLTQFGAPADLLNEDGLFQRVYQQQVGEADPAAV